MTTIFLDWDVGYKDWLRKRDRPSGVRTRGWMENRLGLLRHTILSKEKRIFADYRRSGSGRVHIRLWIIQDLDHLQELTIRTFLKDDPARVYMDIGRWCKGESTNRLFDTKWSKGKIRKAGPWKEWFILPTETAGSVPLGWL